MYSLTFRVCVTTPPQYGRNCYGLVADNVAHAADPPILSLARAAFAGMRSACGMRWAWRIAAGLCHAFLVLPQQRNPCTDCKSAQQSTTRGHPLPLPTLHRGPCNSVGMRPRTDRHTDRHTHTHRRAWPQYISRRLRLTRNVITDCSFVAMTWTIKHCGTGVCDCD